jgi:hypothetical protein
MLGSTDCRLLSFKSMFAASHESGISLLCSLE